MLVSGKTAMNSKINNGFIDTKNWGVCLFERATRVVSSALIGMNEDVKRAEIQFHILKLSCSSFINSSICNC